MGTLRSTPSGPTAVVASTGNIYSGLLYPIVVADRRIDAARHQGHRHRHRLGHRVATNRVTTATSIVPPSSEGTIRTARCDSGALRPDSSAIRCSASAREGGRGAEVARPELGAPKSHWKPRQERLRNGPRSATTIASPSAGAGPPRAEGTGTAGLAQLVEHVICNHGVTGSNPVAGTKYPSKISRL
jgi:hypothetical protein